MAVLELLLKLPVGLLELFLELPVVVLELLLGLPVVVLELLLELLLELPVVVVVVPSLAPPPRRPPILGQVDPPGDAFTYQVSSRFPGGVGSRLAGAHGRAHALDAARFGRRHCAAVHVLFMIRCVILNCDS